MTFLPLNAQLFSGFFEEKWLTFLAKLKYLAHFCHKFVTPSHKKQEKAGIEENR
jgi:hypothetical protein